MNGSLELKRNQINRLNQLKIEKQSKEQFFSKTDLISASNSSFYADRLALNKPDGLTWNELNINPSLGKIERGEDLEFKIKTINIDGRTESSKILDNWIASLNDEEWIKSINIKGFLKIENKNQFGFNLEILIK